ncbi:sialidase-4 [Camelus ferus]|nr:sialidase-4 [Camelus ferus]
MLRPLTEAVLSRTVSCGPWQQPAPGTALLGDIPLGPGVQAPSPPETCGGPPLGSAGYPLRFLAIPPNSLTLLPHRLLWLWGPYLGTLSPSSSKALALIVHLAGFYWLGSVMTGSPKHSMGAPRIPVRTVLFQRERTGLTYRVPALLPVPPGPTLLAFAEQRLSPDDAHAHRLVQRIGTLVGGSVRWGAAHVLGTAALKEHRSMNPCPVHDTRTATIFLFFIAVRGRTSEATQIAAGRNAARLCCVMSRDAGHSWGGVRDLTAEAVGGAEQDWATFAVGPGHGIQLHSGRLLVPAYAYRVDRRECFGKICRTSPHSFAFYSDDHGRTWHRGGLVPNLRSGECQLAMVDSEQASGVLYCNARSPQGSRVQAISVDGGASFLPGELVTTLTETAWGCQGSIGPTWLLYSHPVGHRARLHMGIHLSRSPLDPHSWTGPWVIYEGPSGYSDLACVGPTSKGVLTFACLYESGARASYEEISFCLFSLREVLENARCHLHLLWLVREGLRASGACWCRGS